MSPRKDKKVMEGSHRVKSSRGTYRCTVEKLPQGQYA